MENNISKAIKEDIILKHLAETGGLQKLSDSIQFIVSKKVNLISLARKVLCVDTDSSLKNVESKFIIQSENSSHVDLLDNIVQELTNKVLDTEAIKLIKLLDAALLNSNNTMIDIHSCYMGIEGEKQLICEYILINDEYFKEKIEPLMWKGHFITKDKDQTHMYDIIRDTRIRDMGIVGYFKGAQIIVNKNIRKGMMYFLPSPEFIGYMSMPEDNDLFIENIEISDNADNNMCKASINAITYSNMVISNPDRIFAWEDKNI